MLYKIGIIDNQINRQESRSDKAKSKKLKKFNTNRKVVIATGKDCGKLADWHVYTRKIPDMIFHKQGD
jgi:hypothetical protein